LERLSSGILSFDEWRAKKISGLLGRKTEMRQEALSTTDPTAKRIIK
jgi:hypothetical protein